MELNGWPSDDGVNELERPIMSRGGVICIALALLLLMSLAGFALAWLGNGWLGESIFR